jgi:phosphatidylglycerol lysyltransferase
MIGVDQAAEGEGAATHPSPLSGVRYRFARIAAALPVIVGGSMFVGAVLVLHETLHDFHYVELKEALASIGRDRIGLAILFTALSFLALTACEYFGLRFARKPLPYARAGLASFITQSIAHFTGFGILVGTTLRYRLYAGQGLGLAEVARVQLYFTSTFGLGMAVLGAAVLVLEPGLLAGPLGGPDLVWQGLGSLVIVAIAAYVVWGAFFRRPVVWAEHDLTPPPAGATLMQIVLGVVDLGATAAALYVLLPSGLGLSFPATVGIFVAAVIVGLASNVPGGLGVFESAVILLAAPAPEQTVPLVGALLAFRAVYYLLPLISGAGILSLLELGRWLELIHGFARGTLRMVGPLVPYAAAILTFLAGTVLLLSGATPAVPERLDILNSFVPLPVIEIAHFVGSLLGLVLLVLARGLLDRLAAAWFLTVALLPLGILFSLLKGLDYEESIALLCVLAIVAPYRRQFYRRSSLIDEPLTTGWLVAIGVTLAASWWLVTFAYRHVEYSHALWWQVELAADAPRTLRAALGVGVLALLVGFAQLLRPSASPPRLPTRAELERAGRILAANPAGARLALTGDKAFLFNASGDGFIMYAVSGRSWIAMGEPVGPESAWPELLWAFRTLADRHQGRVVFYEVDGEHLPPFLDLGLTPVKLGEYARVHLPGFGIEGKRGSDLRYARRRAAKEGGSFEILPPERVPAVLDDLEEVSDAWLDDHKAREKRFSLGFFSRDYVSQCPVAVIRKGGRIVAFANLWLSRENGDCSIDLMRFTADAPYGTMDYLFVELLLWAKAEGFTWFDLGMAPLSGLPDHRLAPLWSRLGRFMFKHGAHFYNFQGLRAYKEKFGPVWQPAYLLCPRLSIARALADVSALISGGWLGMVRK